MLPVVARSYPSSCGGLVNASHYFLFLYLMAAYVLLPLLNMILNVFMAEFVLNKGES